MDNGSNNQLLYGRPTAQQNGHNSAPVYKNDELLTAKLLDGEPLNGGPLDDGQSASLHDQEVSEQEALDELREILVAPEQNQIEVLRTDISSLQAWTEDEHLFDRMTPIVNLVIEKQIREAPQDVIELLYPLLGGMVKRSVQEAISNLAEQIDAQRQKAFNFQRLFSKFRAESNGASSASVDLRDALPFTVQELFVIHRASGLLIHHQSRNPEDANDSDIISAMLTAIGAFVQDAFGTSADGELKEIEYGDKLVLLEVFQHVYVAAVADGTEPFDYRHEIRRRLSTFERSNWATLSKYDGDSSKLDIHTESLQKLLYFESYYSTNA